MFHYNRVPTFLLNSTQLITHTHTYINTDILYKGKHILPLNRVVSNGATQLSFHVGY